MTANFQKCGTRHLPEREANSFGRDVHVLVSVAERVDMTSCEDYHFTLNMMLGGMIPCIL